MSLGLMERSGVQVVSGFTLLPVFTLYQNSLCWVLYQADSMMSHLIGWHVFRNQLNDRQAHSCTVQAKPIVLQLEPAILSSWAQDGFQMNNLACRHHHYAKALKTSLLPCLIEPLCPPLSLRSGTGMTRKHFRTSPRIPPMYRWVIWLVPLWHHSYNL